MIESIGLTENGNLCGEVTINNIQCHFFVRKEFYSCSSEYLLEDEDGEEYTITLGFGPLWFEPGMAILGEWPSLKIISKYLAKKRLKINDRWVVDEARGCWAVWEEIKECYSLR